MREPRLRLTGGPSARQPALRRQPTDDAAREKA